ncbi:MAG TPA: hypothetical protein VFC47_14075, partial [Caulobacteraceae bacterium]|nr:hypothetical protein [Caulobacteraceae bacterium]
ETLRFGGDSRDRFRGNPAPATRDQAAAAVPSAAGMRCVVEKPIKADRFAEAINLALAGAPAALGTAAAA